MATVHCKSTFNTTCDSCGGEIREGAKCVAIYAAGESQVLCTPCGKLAEPGPMCMDCGEPDVLTGHMGCQYPQDREAEDLFPGMII